MNFKFEIVTNDNANYTVEVWIEEGEGKIKSIRDKYNSIIIPDTEILSKALDRINCIVRNMV